MRYPKHLKDKNKPLLGVVEIISVERSFKAILRWTTDEIKVIDFTKKYLPEWKKANHPYHELAKWTVFKTMFVGEDRTLNWKKDIAIDPDVLYDLSEPLANFELKRKASTLLGKIKKIKTAKELTLDAISEAKSGKVTKSKNVKEMLKKLNT